MKFTLFFAVLFLAVCSYAAVGKNSKLIAVVKSFNDKTIVLESGTSTYEIPKSAYDAPVIAGQTIYVGLPDAELAKYKKASKK